MFKRRKIGQVQRKVLLLLLAGFALGLTHSPTRQFRIIKQVAAEWRKINQQSLRNAIKLLYRSRIVEAKDNHNGTTTLVLSEEGRRLALTYDLDKMNISRPRRWDGKWRMILSDIPESKKKSREHLRYHLKRLGFIEFQKSVYLFPFECEKEMKYLIEYLYIKKYARYALLEKVKNEIDLKNHVKLI